MAARKPAGAEVVRQFARENGATGAFVAENTRGRLPKEWIEKFEKETGMRYVAGHTSEKKITLKPTKVDSKGNRRRRPVQKSLAEVRALAGDVAGKRGVPSAKAIAAAEAALSDPLTEAEIAKAAAAVEKPVVSNEK